MSTNDNPGTLPINLYAVGPPNVQPLDLTKLGDHPLQHFPQVYRAFIRVKPDSLC